MLSFGFGHAAARIALSFVFAMAVLCAQQSAGEIRVNVADPTGAGIAVSGVLVNAAMSAEIRFQTDAFGAYRFERLASGRYRLDVSKRGFLGQSVTIDVEVGSAVTRTIVLELAGGAFTADVVATTPLAGIDLTRDEIAAPVQIANQKDLQDSGALDLSDFLNRRITAVHVNEIQGNPFQVDVNYRGYTASPLLGTPQGISIYMDGVRLNQPFGDVVSWDLIPRIAIAELTLMPGSNPLFGLNTLGGALSIQTKDGNSNPRTSIAMSGGSFGRKAAEIEHGGANAKGLNWYLASNLLFEDGWRESSPSNVRQFFGKLGWQREKTTLGVSFGYANNALTGNGLQEQRFFAKSYAGVYTKPDITTNRAPMVNATLRHAFTNRLTFFGNAYYRNIRSRTLNGDLNQDSLDQSIYQPSAGDRAALTAAGFRGFPVSGANAANTPFPSWRCIAQVLLRDEPAEKCTGLLNRTRTAQHNGGIAGQMAWSSDGMGSWRNQFVVGAAFDRSSLHFLQTSQLGYLNPDLTVTGVNAFADGVTGGDIDGEPYDTRVDLAGRVHTASVYATNTVSVASRLQATFSGRFNRTVIDNKDGIRRVGVPGSLDGNHVFSRFNPALGLTYNATALLNTYFGYSEGSRAPTSVELGCADPERPCKLPNAMAGDPPLRQVVTRTFEAGVRGKLESGVAWSAGWFRADNRDDIQFVAAGANGFGYFRNFGKTRRQGVEVDLNARVRRLTIGGGYTFLDATYQSAETFQGSSNSTNATALAGKRGLDGVIAVRPGRRIPLVPRQVLKAYADLQATSKLTLDAGLVATSSSFARGNENNLHQPIGPVYLGPGVSPGYAVLHAGARYQLSRRVQLFVQVNNLLDRRYFSAAQLGTTGFSAEHTVLARPFAAIEGQFPLQHATFYAPGAPRGAWGGLRVRF